MTMTKSSDGPSLPLEQCVHTIKQHLQSAPKAPPKELARLYLAAVALVCHLSVDQRTLHQARKSREGQDSLIPCPAPQKIPAITVVLQDSQLFYSLLACLKMSDATDSNAEAGTPRSKRNRAYSFGGVDADNTPASKMMKIEHSPQKKLASRSTVDHQPELPSIPLPVFAATILYSAFQHVDHWPAPLVQAYAEDSFGPRQWVDDKRCSLLVQNLELAHKGQEAVADEASLAQAARVARYYENLPADEHVNHVPSRPTTLASQPHDRQRSMSLDSVGASAAAPSDSDSGDEEGCFIEVSSGRLAKAGNGGGDDSSSSGEDEEMVVMNTPLEEVSSSRRSSLQSETTTATSNPVSSFPGAPKSSLKCESATPRLNPLSSFPGAPRFLNLTRIRRRYVGVNLDHAHMAILSSLSCRLNLRFKQNSKLLLALPSFVCIPAVRRLATRHLERWLQSPALSGPARALFAATVLQMRHVDPPLPDDIETIDNILGMRLKANQLSMHIENVTEIVKRIPNVTVSRQIFLRILREQIAIMESGNTSSPTELMQMLAAVYGALPSTLSCEGLAMAFLTLLAEPTEGGESSFVARRERQQEVNKIRSLVRSVASTLGSGFDGCGLIASLLSFDVNAESWSLEDEEDRARLLYECATLLVPLPFKEDSRHKSQRKAQHRHSDSRSDEEIASLRSNLKRARKLMLNWCCNEYAPRWQVMNDKKKAHHELLKKCLKRGGQAEEPMGAGPPDYNSVLNGEETTKSPKCLDTMRCVLFMVDAESTELQEFLFPGEPFEMKDQAPIEYQYRIQQCCEYGSDLDDDMLWKLLKSAALPNGGIDSSMALHLIEALFERCNKDRTATLQLTDPKLVWALYRLVEYFPPPPWSLAQNSGAEITNGRRSGNGASTGKIQNGTHIPSLAYPGMWWRVTTLTLVMCAASPEHIGNEVWMNHPTVQALIKMVTSGRYRFPTVDCDEEQRKEMKATETRIRDEESRIAERLFLPPPPQDKITEPEDNGIVSSHGGSRVSARQREKQERLLKQQREREAAFALAEENRRKKLLRTAQKSIMLWDPRGPARKPSKESVPLILSAENLFGLSKVFQQTVNPDFMLMTIGQTSRAAIERAFDWVIPVISSVPEIISRLPASASCFLLLRAYGEGGEGKTELRKLSAPLLEHVRKSLTGEFGEADAVRAADLLLTDMADPNPDRRRCARRVLLETLGHFKSSVDVGANHDSREPDSTGLLCLLQVPHSEAIVSDAIKYISRGLAFERGKVLRALVIALNQFISFAAERNIASSWNFASILCDAISSRHNVCSEAMDRFPDFRWLAIKVVHHKFQECINVKADTDHGDSENLVLIQLCEITESDDTVRKKVVMPLALLQSMCVLLSTWKDPDDQHVDPSSKDAIQTLADALMYPNDHQETEVEQLDGVVGATMMNSGERAVTVEQWVMLAKARSDFIARRAALSAPTLFLPRLLLCSGLPTSSLLTMIDRLGKLGDMAEDREKVFKDLLLPSVTNEWAAWYPVNRREIARKLIGRLSAYLRLNPAPLDSAISLSFLQWLSVECLMQTKPKKSRAAKKSPKGGLTKLGSLTSDCSSGYIISSLGKLDPGDTAMPDIEESPIALESFAISDSIGVPEITDATDRNVLLASIEKCRTENRPEAIEAFLETAFQHDISAQASRAGIDGNNDVPVDKMMVCTVLLKALFERNHDDRFATIVLKWVPTLSESRGTPVFWASLFSSHPQFKATADSLRHRCTLLWCKAHVLECQQWILSNHHDLCVASILRFLISTCDQPSVHIQTFISSTTRAQDFWGASKSRLTAGVTIALQGAQEQENPNVNASISLPDWLVLLMLLARNGKESMKRVCDMLLEAMEKDHLRASLRSAILRLYASFPMEMKLGDPRLRAVLVEGVKSVPWLDWRGALDAQLEDMLVSVQSTPRMAQALIELAKSHPLLVLRKVPTMVRLLEDDGGRHGKARGRTYGENLLGSMEANLMGKSVKVTVRHWGYSLSEPLWVSLLDILKSIPRELLFSCGSYMGLGDLLGIYAKLLFIQCQIQSNPTRVKSKFADFLDEFKSSDPKGWESWLGLKQPELLSLGSTRNILISCSLITPTLSQNQVERIRNAKS